MAGYGSTHRIPGAPLYRGTSIPEEVTILPLSTNGERHFVASNIVDENKLKKLLMDCVEEWSNEMDVSILSYRDRLWFDWIIRMESYGPFWFARFPCPNSSCKTYMKEPARHRVNMREFDVVNLYFPGDTDANGNIVPQDAYRVKLPVKGNIIDWLPLSGAEDDLIDEETDGMLMSNTASPELTESIKARLRLAKQIRLIDGEPVDAGTKYEFVESLRGRDLMVLRIAVESKEFGVNMLTNLVCFDCGMTRPGPQVIVPLDGEFFRPKFDGFEDPVTTGHNESVSDPAVSVAGGDSVPSDTGKHPDDRLREDASVGEETLREKSEGNLHTEGSI
jgi:hypothetical protein